LDPRRRLGAATATAGTSFFVSGSASFRLMHDLRPGGYGQGIELVSFRDHRTADAFIHARAMRKRQQSAASTSIATSASTSRRRSRIGLRRARKIGADAPEMEPFIVPRAIKRGREVRRATNGLFGTRRGIRKPGAHDRIRVRRCAPKEACTTRTGTAALSARCI
jgi:hypothetical protein